LHDEDEDDMTWYRLDVFELDDGQPGHQVVWNYRYPSQPDHSDDLGG
jgi:hypothetical protein